MDNQVLEEIEVPLRSVGASSNAGHPRVAKQNPRNICRQTPAPLSQSPTSQDRNNGSPLSAKFSFVVVVTACSASQMAVANLGFLDLTLRSLGRGLNPVKPLSRAIMAAGTREDGRMVLLRRLYGR